MLSKYIYNHISYLFIFCINLFCLAQAAQPIKPERFGIDYHASMSVYEHLYKIERVLKNPQWHVFIDSYEKWIVKDCEIADQPRIPKIIHQIWLGSPLPEKYVTMTASWKKFHPDWEYKLWTDKDVQEFGLHNQQQYDMAENYGEKADIARYEIICRYGGLYIDTDFECVQAFDILHHCCDFYTGTLGCQLDWVCAANGLIGARPQHPILQACVTLLPKRTGDENNSFRAIHIRSGPEYFTECIFKILPHCQDRSVIFPATYFYPWPWYNRKKYTEQQARYWIKPETFAIHYWHCSWNNQEAK